MTGDTTAIWTAAERAAFESRRRSRNIAIGLLLGALVALFFGITVVRMAPGVGDGKPQPQAASASAGAAKP